MTIVGTASYGHTLMRVRTMSDGKIQRRDETVAAIGKLAEAYAARGDWTTFAKLLFPGAATDGDGEKCEKLCLHCLSPDRHEHVQTNCATRQVQRLLYSSATTLASCSNFFKLMGELASGEESFMKESVVENFTVTPLSVLT